MFDQKIIASPLFTLLISILISSGVHGQFTIQQIGNSTTVNVVHSVQVLNDRILAGSISDPYNDSNFEIYSYENSTNSWGTLHSMTQVGVNSYYVIRDFAFINDDVGIASFSPHATRFTSPNMHVNDPIGECFIMKTNDGGLTWDRKHAKTVKNEDESIEEIDFFDSQNGIAVGTFYEDYVNFVRDTYIALTSDAGETWTELTIPASMKLKPIYDLDIVSATEAYIVMIDGDVNIPNNLQRFYVYKTSNKGLTWQLITDELLPDEYNTEPFIHAHFYPKNIEFVGLVGYIAFSEKNFPSILYKTTDGGTTWNEVPHPLRYDLGRADMDFNDMIFIEENEGFIAAGLHCGVQGCYNGHSLLHTADGGNTWDIISYSFSDEIIYNSITYDKDLRVGYIGGGDIWDDNGGVYRFQHVTAGMNENDIPIRIEAYPNPTKDGEITLTLNFKDPQEIDVFTIDGKLVNTYLVTNGEIQIQLEKGAYIIRANESTVRVLAQ